MSAEQPNPIMKTDREKSEIFPKGLEAKIRIIKDLWTISQSLPIPTTTQPRSEVLSEYAMLDNIFSQAKTKFPRAASAFSRYSEIEAEIDAHAKLLGGKDQYGLLPDSYANSNEYKRLSKEQAQIETNPDFWFLLMLKNGIDTALSKRDEIRKEQAKHQESSPQRGKASTPEAYDVSVNGVRLKGKIDQVIFGKYAIHLLLAPQVYNLVDPSSGDGEFSNGIFTVINKDNTPEQIKQTIKHEDFHSFLEGFIINRRVPKNIAIAIPATAIILRDLTSKIAIYKNGLKIHIPEDFTEMNLQRVKNTIAEIFRYSNEELLAEMAETTMRSDFPSTTFTSIDEVVSNTLDDFRNIDPKIDSAINQALQESSHDKIIERIRCCYKAITKSAPEKRLDLDSAFFIIPYYQIDVIEALVNNWINKDQENT
jgi:hypothetical protein